MEEQNRTSLTERGLEAFLRGFSAARSMTHAYLVRQVSPSIRVLSDAPRTRGSARKSEVIVYGAGPEETIETIRREANGCRQGRLKEENNETVTNAMVARV